ncbi:MAG: site-2 protease family protein, partial [Bacteroidetes bacterium]
YHSVNTTLPFYIPAPPFLVNPFGTLGAVIRIREPLRERKALFDIGIAGPLAGLVATFLVLIAGFITLPDKAFLYTIHPEYLKGIYPPEPGLAFGDSLFFIFLKVSFSGSGFIPPMNEIYHYPFLCAGWFGLFITAMNLLPVGQLDGGHILYALLGTKQGIISRIFLVIIILLGVSSFLPFVPWVYEPSMTGWLLWAAILYFIIKIDHPPIPDETPLDTKRKILGWATLIFFIFIFIPLPFSGIAF